MQQVCIFTIESHTSDLLQGIIFPLTVISIRKLNLLNICPKWY